MAETLSELERGVHAALETYSNVHRGSGHNSLVSTRLFEQARDIVLEHLGLDRDSHVVVFCTPRRAELLKAQLAPGSYHERLQPGHRPATGREGVGCRQEGPAQRRSFPDWRRDGPTRLPRVGHLGQGTGEIRGRHARDRQRHRLRQGAAADPASRTGRSAGCDRRTADARRDSATRRAGGIHRETAAGRAQADPDRSRGSRPDSGRRRALRQPGQRRQHAHVRADMGSRPPDMAPAQAGAAGARSTRSGPSAPVCWARRSADYDVIFTSNTTEAINLAAESLRRESEQGGEPVVLNTFLEHNSNELPWRTASGALADPAAGGPRRLRGRERAGDGAVRVQPEGSSTEGSASSSWR